MNARVSTAMLTGAAVPVLALALIGGMRAYAPLGLVFLVPLFFVARRRGHQGARDPGWVTSAWPAPTGPSQPRPASTARSVAVALARVEGRELLLSPAFAVGAGIAVLLYLALGLVGAPDQNGPWETFIGLMPFAAHPLLGFIALAAHLGVTRSRRHGCDEVFDACPVDRDARLVGHVLTGVLGAGLVVAYATAFFVTVAARGSGLYGPRAGLVPTVLTCAVLGAGAVALGCVTGRWLRWSIAPVLALVGIAWFSEWNAESARWQTRRFLGSADVGDPALTMFVHRPLWAHLAWLAACAALLACVALARASRAAVVGIGLASVAAAVAAVAVMQPIPDAAAAEIAARIADPAAHQTCVPAGEVRVCAYERYGDWAERAADEIRPVVAAVPAAALRGLVFMQFPTDSATLPAEVIGERAPVRPDGAQTLGFHSGHGDLLALRLRVAAAAVHAPTEPANYGAYVIAGQARGVLVLWLASRGLDADDARGLAPVRDTGSARADALAWPTECGRGGALAWSRQDFRAARMLLAQPAEGVATVLESGWTTFADPSTTTDELLGALDLPLVGPPDPGIGPTAYSC